MGKTQTKQNIADRFGERYQAEKYRDRFNTGRRLRTHLRESEALSKLLAQFGKLPVILDIGSGAGRFIPTFGRIADRVVQADFSRSMLAVAKEQHERANPNTSFVNADICSLPFDKNTTDLIFCHRLLNHLPDAERRRAMAEFLRVSRKYVVISCLSAPAPLRLLRSCLNRLRGRQTDSDQISARDVLDEATGAGLTLTSKLRFRSFPVMGEFFVFSTVPKTTIAAGRPTGAPDVAPSRTHQPLLASVSTAWQRIQGKIGVMLLLTCSLLIFIDCAQ